MKAILVVLCLMVATPLWAGHGQEPVIEVCEREKRYATPRYRQQIDGYLFLYRLAADAVRPGNEDGVADRQRALMDLWEVCTHNRVAYY